MHIARIEEKDVRDVYDLFVALHAEGSFDGVPIDEGKALAHLQEHVDSRFPAREIFVARSDLGEAVGAMKCFRVPYWYSNVSRAVHELLYVKPEFRSSGVAVKLFKAFEHWAKEVGVDQVTASMYIPDPDGRAAFNAMMKKLDYEQVGALYKKDIAHVR